MADLWLIRHAPALDEGRLAGRRDVDADTAGVAPLALRPDTVVASPARRCVSTAAALFPGRAPHPDPRLWEQDFGDWEGREYAALPDLGTLDSGELSDARPHNGESFWQMCARVAPALEGLEGTVAVIAHAGTVRAALARACGSVPAALAFQVAPLSLTRIVTAPAGWSVVCVNRPLP